MKNQVSYSNCQINRVAANSHPHTWKKSVDEKVKLSMFLQWLSLTSNWLEQNNPVSVGLSDPLLVGSFIGWIHLVVSLFVFVLQELPFLVAIQSLFVFVAISANIGMVDHSILVVCHREQKPNTISTGIWYIYWRLPLKFVGEKIPWWLYWAKTNRLLDNLWNIQGERTRVVRPGEGELVEG